MYKVKTKNTTYQNIESFEVWNIDGDYLKFHWSDKKYLVVAKNLILTLEKYA